MGRAHLCSAGITWGGWRACAFMWLRGTLAVSRVPSCIVALIQHMGSPHGLIFLTAQRLVLRQARPRLGCLYNLPAKVGQRPGCCVLLPRSQSPTLAPTQGRGHYTPPLLGRVSQSLQSCVKTSTLRFTSLHTPLRGFWPLPGD